MLNDIVDLLEKLEVKEFRVVGNKVLIDKMILTNSNKKDLANIKYDLYVKELRSSFTPKCIKSCDRVFLNTDYKYDGYLPKVKDLLVIYSNSSDKNIYLDNQICNEVRLGYSMYSGTITSNKVVFGNNNSYVITGDLNIEGFDNKPTLLMNILSCKGSLNISNFDTVMLKLLNGFNESNNKIFIKDVNILDLTESIYPFDINNLKLSNVDTLELYGPFRSKGVLEVSTVVFTDPRFDKSVYDSNFYQSLFICNKCVIGGKEYTKNNPYPGTLSNIKFK